METPQGDSPQHFSFMEPLVEAWASKIASAREAKSDFNLIAEQCDAFFSQASGFMWKPKFKSKFLGQVETPKFQVTINKAFELVALFGPSLYWKYPHRKVTVEGALEWDDQILAAPQVAMAVQQRLQVQAPPEKLAEFLRNKQNEEQVSLELAAQLLQRYLNYSQKEMPGGGLAAHSELAITEALVKGRGCLWAETYTHPGSQRVLTGTFYSSVDNLLIDPDCEDPTLTDARWIARRHRQPAWVVERKFGLKRGSLRRYAQYETTESKASRQSPQDQQKRRNNQTFDMVEWYEIWSKGGVGNRLDTQDPDQPRVNGELSDGFDEVVGDFAYCCIVVGCPYFLNAPSTRIATASDDEVAQMFEWRAANYGEPFPAYADDKWPVVTLDFYRKYGSAWPIAPLAPGLGELIALNILASAMVEQAFDNRKQIIAVLQSAASSIKAAVKGTESPAIVEINDNAHKSINEIVQYLNRPNMNSDIIGAIEYVSTLFDKRTGLTEFMYAMNVGGAASRTAKDVAAKEARASVRPDKMSKDVAIWQEAAAELEKFLASWVVNPNHIVPLIGEFGAALWQALITDADPDAYVHSMKCQIGASETRKPNKELEASNLRDMLQYAMPLLRGYAAATGDTEPINGYMSAVGAAIDQDVSDWKLGPWKPQPPPPEVMQAQQQAEQVELQKSQAELQSKQLDAQIKQIELQAAVVESQVQAGVGSAEIKKAEVDAAIRQAEAEQKMQMAAAQAIQKLAADNQQHASTLQQKQEQFAQQMQHDRMQHALGILQSREENQLKLDQMKQQGNLKMRQAKNSQGSKT